MKKLLVLFLLACASLAFGQGVIVAPQVAFKVTNGLTTPIANATITVCAANASGIPCSPALANSVFKDAALTQPLSNPFFADSTGNYQFAIAPGNYTVTVTSSGFNGQSYQITVATPISLAGGLGDPGANGVVFRNGLNTTRPAVSADVIGLWSGSCNVGTVLRGDGSCAAGSSAFSAITSGTNSAASMIVGSGATLNPTAIGQVAGSQVWLAPGLTAPAMTAANSGGNISSAQTVQWQYTFNTASGQSLPSLLLSGGPPAPCVSANCTVTMTAPTIPSGYSGYTAYFCDISAGPCTAPVEVLACVNIGTSCTVSSSTLNSGIAVPTINTAIPQPAGVQANNGYFGTQPAFFFPKTDGNYYPWISVDFKSDPIGSGAVGTPIFTHRTYFSDTATTPFGTQQGYKNAFLSVNHLLGTGTVVTNQDRGLAIQVSGPTADATTHYGVEGVQVEVDNNCTVATCLNGNPDAEYSVFSGQMQDNATQAGYTLGSGYGENVIRGELFKAGAGSTSAGYSILFGRFDINNTSFVGGANAAIVRAICLNNFAFTVNNISCTGLRFTTDPNRFGDGQFAVFVPNVGAFTPGGSGSSRDYLIRNDKHGYDSLFNGLVGSTSLFNSDFGSFPVAASMNLTGGFQTSQIASSWTSGFSGACSGGASQYGYQLVAIDQNGGQVASATVNSPSTCVNPLTSGNPVTLSPPGGANMDTFAKGVLAQAKQIDVYRISGPMATGKVGSISCNNEPIIFACINFSDTGLAATGTVPSTNTTGEAAAAGYLAAQGNKVVVASDFTSAANTNLQTITGLAWNLDAVAKKYSFHCSLMYSQATAAAAMQFGIQASTVAPNDISAKGRIDTSTTAQTSGVLSNLTTTTATAIVTFTPSASATVFGADLDGSIDEPQNNQGQTINIMVQTSNSADLPTVKRGSYCYLY